MKVWIFKKNAEQEKEKEKEKQQHLDNLDNTSMGITQVKGVLRTVCSD